MISDFSERGGAFAFEIYMSNEVTFQEILPDLLKRVVPGGVYLGVAHLLVLKRLTKPWTMRHTPRRLQLVLSQKGNGFGGERIRRSYVVVFVEVISARIGPTVARSINGKGARIWQPSWT
jgi:hypothetical protein